MCANSDTDFGDEPYDNVFLTFSTDYDKENPLTIKKGQLRLLQRQIKKAEADGDENTLAVLKAQQGMVAQ